MEPIFTKIVLGSCHLFCFKETQVVEQIFKVIKFTFKAAISLTDSLMTDRGEMISSEKQMFSSVEYLHSLRD